MWVISLGLNETGHWRSLEVLIAGLVAVILNQILPQESLTDVEEEEEDAMQVIDSEQQDGHR